MADELITLKNSNALIKYPVDADQLNYNFELLEKKGGGADIKDVIESSGQTYSTLQDGQLAMAIAQYVLSCGIFNEIGSGNTYQLTGRDGMSVPYRYTEGMVVTFSTAHTNTGAASIQIEELDPYYIRVDGSNVSPGYIRTNTFLSFVLVKEVVDEVATYYWSPIDSTASSGGSSSGGSGADESNYPALSLQHFITTADLAYTTEDETLLSKAVAQYVAGICYTATYESFTYKLKPTEAHSAPAHYFDGMLVAFVAPDTNSSGSTQIKVGGLPIKPAVAASGSPLDNNTIYANQLVFAMYDEALDSFRILSHYIPAMTLSDGNVLNGITDDIALSTASHNRAVSEYAVRGYVESKLKGTHANTINDGLTDDSNNPIALQIVGGHQIELITGDNAFQAQMPTFFHYVPDASGNNTSAYTDIITSSNDAQGSNLVDKKEDTYWESATTGFAVDNRTRVLEGTPGGKYIDYASTYVDSEQVPVYNDNPPAPEWFGVRNNTFLPEQVRFKFTDDLHKPDEILCQVNFSNSESSGTWYDLVNIAESGEAEESGETFYYEVVDRKYGDLTNVTKDSDGYYRITLPRRYITGTLSGGATQDASLPFPDVPDNPFAFRVVVTKYSQEFPTTELINSDGYDPNADTISPRYPLQVQDFQLGKTIDAPVFSYIFPNSEIGEQVKPIFYSQYVSADESGESGGVEPSVLDILDTGTYMAYISADNVTVNLVKANQVYKTSTAPTTSADMVGAVWFETTSDYPDTYVCEEQSDESGESGDVEYAWVKHNIILAATVTVGNKTGLAIPELKTITNVTYGTKLSRTYDATATMDIDITHNFGQAVTIGCILECISADIDYVAGERVELVPFIEHKYTVVPDTTTTDDENDNILVESTVSFTATSTDNEAHINFQNFELLNRTTGSSQTIANGKWKLKVTINKG